MLTDVVAASNVWLGSKLTIPKGSPPDTTARVGRGAIVNRDIPEKAVAAHVPSWAKFTFRFQTISKAARVYATLNGCDTTMSAAR